MRLKSLINNDEADIKMIGMVVAILVTIIVSLLVFYSIAGSFDINDMDDDFGDYGLGSYAKGQANEQINGSTPVRNSTDAILDQSATFFSIAPIIAIVVVAVVILGYVSRIGG